LYEFVFLLLLKIKKEKNLICGRIWLVLGALDFDMATIVAVAWIEGNPNGKRKEKIVCGWQRESDGWERLTVTWTHWVLLHYGHSPGGRSNAGTQMKEEKKKVLNGINAANYS